MSSREPIRAYPDEKQRLIVLVRRTFTYSYLEKKAAASLLGYLQSLHVGRDVIVCPAGGHVGGDKLSAAASDAQGSLLSPIGTRSPAAEHRRSLVRNFDACYHGSGNPITN